MVILGTHIYRSPKQWALQLSFLDAAHCVLCSVRDSLLPTENLPTLQPGAVTWERLLAVRGSQVMGSCEGNSNRKDLSVKVGESHKALLLSIPPPLKERNVVILDGPLGTKACLKVSFQETLNYLTERKDLCWVIELPGNTPPWTY